jgi:MFS family permease
VPGHRRITAAVGLAMFVDAVLYLALLPLLPVYADRFHLGTAGVGVVLAAYPASTPLVALGCIRLAPRYGGRRIALAASLVMTAATIAFAFAPNAEVLVLARLLQGVASGTVWTASMAWVTSNAPVDRRGRESGIVMGMLSAGSIAGPGIGALAAASGTTVAFLIVAAVSAASFAVTLAAPSGVAVPAERHLRRSMVRASRDRFTRAALAISLIDPLAFGTIDLLVPLDLGHRGSSTAAISAAFAAGAVLGAIVGPIGGRVVDRVGPAPVGFAMALVIAATPLPLAAGLPVGAELGMLVLFGPIFAVAAAALYPLASLGADAARVAHVVVNGFLGAAWAAGFTVAPLLAGAIANAAGQSVALLAASIACVPLLFVLAPVALERPVGVGDACK